MASVVSNVREVLRVLSLPCREHSILISRDTDGELRRATHVGLRLHFALCGPCRHFAEHLRFLRRAAAKLTPAAAERAMAAARMPGEVRARILARMKG